MSSFFSHDSAVIDEGATIGAETKIWHFAHICSGAEIGERCSFGQNTMVASGAKIGNNVKVQNNVAIYTGTIVEDDVFLGPSCVLTNVTNPRSQVVRRGLYEETLIRRGATLGANATIVCGITLGRYSFVGAGAVVAADIPDYGFVLGVPGRLKGWMSRHGHILNFNESNEAVCPESGFRYRLDAGKVNCLDLGEDDALPDELSVGSRSYDELKKTGFRGFIGQRREFFDMEFIDLKTQQLRLREEIEGRMNAVLDHGRYILGPEVGELEAALSDYLGVKHSIGVSSGTDSLLIALLALGIGPGDEVITVPYTWISTAEVIALIGAKPVFIDIDPESWNMDPSQLEAAINEKTKAIMPVGIYGQTADMKAINEIASRNGNLPVIEDAAQSFGAEHHGIKSCALSTIGSTSFFPSKPLGGYGDGGALFTNDDEIATKMRSIRVHGQESRHHHPVIGLNGRLDSLQAAIILPKLKIFPEEVALRAEVGQRYTELLDGTPGISCPKVAEGNTSVYAQYTLLCENRDEVQAKLKERGVPSVPYYAVPLHLQPVFSDLGHQKGDYPVTEMVADRCLSLPMSPYISAEEQEQVAEAIRS